MLLKVLLKAIISMSYNDIVKIMNQWGVQNYEAIVYRLLNKFIDFVLFLFYLIVLPEPVRSMRPVP